MGLLKHFEQMVRSWRGQRSPRYACHKDLVFNFDRNGRSFSCHVRNISTCGIGLEVYRLENPLERDDEVSGYLQWESLKVALKARVAHVTKSRVGLEVENSSEFVAFLTEHFSPELDAAELRVIAAENLDFPSEGEPHWLYSAQGNEIFYCTQDNVVTYAIVHWRGQVMECAHDGPVRYGRLRETSSKDGPGQYKASAIWDLSDDLDKDHLHRFVCATSVLSEDHRDQILAWPSNSPLAAR